MVYVCTRLFSQVLSILLSVFPFCVQKSGSSHRQSVRIAAFKYSLSVPLRRVFVPLWCGRQLNSSWKYSSPVFSLRIFSATTVNLKAMNISSLHEFLASAKLSASTAVQVSELKIIIGRIK